MQSSALVQGASTYYFLSDSDGDDSYKISSDCYSVLFGKISDPFSQSSFFLIYYFPPSSPPYTRMSDLLLLLCHINLLPKLLGSSRESEKPLLRYHFHINVAKMLVVEHLMWRQQLFLETAML